MVGVWVVRGGSVLLPYLTQGSNFTTPSLSKSRNMLQLFAAACSSITYFAFATASVLLIIEAILYEMRCSHHDNNPVSYPILGCLISVRKNQHRLFDWLTDELRKAPSHTTRITIPHATIIATANPANVEHILKTKFSNYVKGEKFHNLLSDFLGDGIFNVDKDLWRMQRKAAVTQFSGTLHRRFVLDTARKELEGRLIPLLSDLEAKGVCPDIQDLLMRFSFDNVCQITCGVDPVCLHPSLGDVEFAEAFEKASQIVFRRFLSLAWRVKRMLHIGEEKVLKEAVDKVNTFTFSVLINKRKNELKSVEGWRQAENGQGRDLLSRLILAEGGEGEFSDMLLKDMVVSFLLAGKDTTSSALAWFFRFLCLHPHVQEKIHREIKSVKNSSGNGNEEFMTLEELKQMHYLHAALSESMRLYPPVPVDSKYAVEDDILPDGTVVRKGERVSYNVYAMGRLESIWGGDCMEFKPERWLDEGNKFKEVSWFKYPVFQAGPRVCVGKEMAFIQMKCVVANLILRFQFSSATAAAAAAAAARADDMEIDSGKAAAAAADMEIGSGKDNEVLYDIAFILRMKRGMPVRLKARGQCDSSSSSLPAVLY